MLRFVMGLPARHRRRVELLTVRFCPYCDHQIQGKPATCPGCKARISNNRASHFGTDDGLASHLHGIIKPKPQPPTVRQLLDGPN